MQKFVQKSKNKPGARMAILVILMSCLAMVSAWAQENSISGKLTSSEDQRPLPGVSIVVKGTATGTITDANGNFKINAAPNATLVFSYVGFTTQEFQVNNQTSVSVVLASDSKQLNEVVVTALGVRKEARTIGYATQDIKGDELVKAREPNTVNSLVGKIAGLNIGTSPELLGRPNIVMRGNTDLLFVVNGVPVNSDTWNLPADDIDTYTVLKGPNATALYGQRGQNGAIVITTKNGRGSAVGREWAIDFNSSTMVENGFTAFPKNNSLYGRGTNYAYSYGNGLYDFGPTSTLVINVYPSGVLNLMDNW